MKAARRPQRKTGRFRNRSRTSFNSTFEKRTRRREEGGGRERGGGREMEHKHPSVGSAGGGEEEANYRRGGGERGGTPARRPITPPSCHDFNLQLRGNRRTTTTGWWRWGRSLIPPQTHLTCSPGLPAPSSGGSWYLPPPVAAFLHQSWRKVRNSDVRVSDLAAGELRRNYGRITEALVSLAAPRSASSDYALMTHPDSGSRNIKYIN